MKSIVIDGVEYVEKSKHTRGNRYIVQIDRGWTYAGDVKRENGRIFLDRVVWLRSWKEVWFDGAIKDPKSDQVNLVKFDYMLEIPEQSELYSVKVEDDWGL